MAAALDRTCLPCPLAWTRLPVTSDQHLDAPAWFRVLPVRDSPRGCHYGGWVSHLYRQGVLLGLPGGRDHPDADIHAVPRVSLHVGGLGGEGRAVYMYALSKWLRSCSYACSSRVSHRLVGGRPLSHPYCPHCRPPHLPPLSPSLPPPSACRPSCCVWTCWASWP